jgi:hypothetical protein
LVILHSFVPVVFVVVSVVKSFDVAFVLLYGQAQSAISGLTLSNENYDVTVDILKERFGDVQTAVNTHYVELINLPLACKLFSVAMNENIPWNIFTA